MFETNVKHYERVIDEQLSIGRNVVNYWILF